MKTRSNMPLYVLEVSDVKALSNSQIDLLRCGDYLVKKDASGEHAYKVTFKSDTGMCITYHDASVIETQSYDKVDGVWVYNSEDKTPNLLDAQTENDVKALVEGGALENAKPIYCHPIHIENQAVGESNYHLTFLIFNNDSYAYDYPTFKQWLSNLAEQIEPNEVQLLCSGGIASSDKQLVIIASYLFYNTTNEVVGIAGITPSGVLNANYTSLANIDSLFGASMVFKDAVNKIN